MLYYNSNIIYKLPLSIIKVFPNFFTSYYRMLYIVQSANQKRRNISNKVKSWLLDIIIHTTYSTSPFLIGSNPLAKISLLP